MEYAAVFLILLVVALVVTRPLRRGAPDDEPESELVDQLEAAKEAKYREIRDAEVDFRTGKLSEADFRTTDRELRAQAIEILRRLDDARGESPSR